MQIDRIYAFGCSNTYGEGLADCWGPDNTDPYYIGTPSKFSYPRVLAQRLGINSASNYSVPGNTNTMIAHQTLSTTVPSNTLVVIGWTYWARETIITTTNTQWAGREGMRFGHSNGYRTIAPWILESNLPKDHKTLPKLYYKHWYNGIDHQLRALRNLELVDLHFQKTSTPVIHINTERLTIPKPNWVRARIYTKTIEDFQSVRSDRALDDRHPSTECHKLIAHELAVYAHNRWGLKVQP